MSTHLTAALGISLFVAGLVNGMDYERAAGMMPSGPPYLRSGQQEIGLRGRLAGLDAVAPPYLQSGQQEIGHPVEGEVVRIDGDYYFVEDPSGNEIRLIVNESTLRTGPIKQGERVEARVNNEDHALSIRPIRPLSPDPADGSSSGGRR